MKKLVVAILAFCVLALPSLSQAGGTSNRAKVQFILTTQGNAVFFKVGAQYGGPACSTATGEWAINLTGTSAAAGKAMLASLLAAQAQGKDVWVAGTGVCDIWQDRETVGYMIVYTD